MSEKELRDSRCVENFNPPWIVEQLVHKVRKSVADAFLEQIEYGKDYVIKTKMVEDDWEDGYGTRYTYNLKFEELVRCEDCVYRNPEASEAIWEEDGKLVRGFPEKSAYLCHLINRCVDLSGFCKWGQKKEER